MPKKKDQGIKLTPTTDSERETRVLLEDVRSGLKIVAEGHTSIVRRLDKVEDKLEQHDHRFDQLEGKLGQVDGRLNKIEGQLDQLQNQVTSVLTDHEHRLKALEVK